MVQPAQGALGQRQRQARAAARLGGLGAPLAAVLLLSAGDASAAYRYGGYTPLHDHAGERAAVGAPRCPVRLVAASDHDAAYVDVSNEKATMWGQAGWWLGTSGSGRFFGSPVGYIEYRLSDGTYLWKALGPPPPGARYSVANSGLTLHDAAGHAMPLYRITASFVTGTLATYPYPQGTGDNAGLAESYSASGITEPIGPAAYAGIELLTNGRWRLWRPQVDAASATVGAGDHLTLLARWHRWRVVGHLRVGAPRPASAGTSQAGGSPGAWPRARWPRSLDRGGWRLFAPRLADGPGGAVEVGAMAADRRGRLVGTAVDAGGRLLLWRWRPSSSGAAPAEVWRLGDQRSLVGGAGGPDWVALGDGGAAYAAGGAILWLPPGAGRVAESALGRGGPGLAAAAGPDGTVAVIRRVGPTLELWRRSAGAPARRVRAYELPAAAGAADAMIYLGGGRWLLSQPTSPGGAYGRLTALALPASGGRAVLHTVAVPGLNLAAAGGVVAVDGGDRSRGVRVRPRAGGTWRSPAALAAAAVWGDAVAVAPDSRVWLAEREAGATLLVGWRRGQPLARVALPPLWVEESPPLGNGRTGQGPIAAAPAYVVALAAGPGWVAAAPAGQAAVLVALRPATPGPLGAPGARSGQEPSP